MYAFTIEKKLIALSCDWTKQNCFMNYTSYTTPFLYVLLILKQLIVYIFIEKGVFCVHKSAAPPHDVLGDTVLVGGVVFAKVCAPPRDLSRQTLGHLFVWFCLF